MDLGASGPPVPSGESPKRVSGGSEPPAATPARVEDPWPRCYRTGVTPADREPAPAPLQAGEVRPLRGSPPWGPRSRLGACGPSPDARSTTTTRCAPLSPEPAAVLAGAAARAYASGPPCGDGSRWRDAAAHPHQALPSLINRSARRQPVGSSGQVVISRNRAGLGSIPDVGTRTVVRCAPGVLHRPEGAWMTERTVVASRRGAPPSAYLVGNRRRGERPGRECERKRRDALEQARQAARPLRSQFGAVDMIAFGSMVRSGLLDDRSNIDLAVSGTPPDRFLRAWAEATAAVSRPLGLVDLDDCPARLRELVREEGEPLWHHAMRCWRTACGSTGTTRARQPTRPDVAATPRCMAARGGGLP